MLNTVKEAIQKQKSFLEASSLILEDVSGNLDDTIVLGESSSMIFTEDAPDADTSGMEDDTPDGGDVELGAEEGPVDTPTPEEPEGENDVGNEPISDETPDATPPVSTGSDDIGNAPIDDPIDTPVDSGADDIGNAPINPEPSAGPGEEPLPMPGDDLPTPVGKQTGEPVEDDNIVDVNLDLQSNTMRDVLPVPPAGAAQAIDSDSLETHVDSGFGGDDVGGAPIDSTPTPTPAGGMNSSTDIGDLPADEDPPVPDTTVTEAITIGGGDEEPPAEITAAAASEELPAEPGADGAPADIGGEPVADEENAVTAAVRDKVAETEDEDVPAGKDDILKKLLNVSKSVEDIKKAVIDSAQ